MGVCNICGQSIIGHPTVCDIRQTGVTIQLGPIVWTSQHDAMESSIAMFRHQLERHIREWWGERCADFDPDCFCCQKWAAFDQVIENNMEQRTDSKPRV